MKKSEESVLERPAAISLMRRGGILAADESPEDMLQRLQTRLLETEAQFAVPASEAQAFTEQLLQASRSGLISLGTPILTHAGRRDCALSSCVAIPGTKSPAQLSAYYDQDMGSGFNLSAEPNPVDALLALNEHAAQETRRRANRGTRRRAIANLANLDIGHPQVLDFIDCKQRRDDLVHFNLSVNLSADFIAALRADTAFLTPDGRRLAPRKTLALIAEAAWACGDPGIIALDRYNADNPTPGLACATTTAPCAEVGLIPGEACVFGTINLAALYDPRQPLGLDFDRLRQATSLLTRALDDALEASLPHYPSPTTTRVMAARRKIGIGLCGLADFFLALNLPYGSAGSIQVLREVLQTMTWQSKWTSCELARQRGSFLEFKNSRYCKEPDFSSRRFANPASESVPAEAWRSLDARIQRQGLRHCATTALPPTGRSSQILGVSASIEPLFSLQEADGSLRNSCQRALDLWLPEPAHRSQIIKEITTAQGSLQASNRAPRGLKSLLRKAVEIPWEDQLQVLAIASSNIDEAVSKTINLAQSVDPSEVLAIYERAIQLGLKAISIYRDGSRTEQPQSL